MAMYRKRKFSTTPFRRNVKRRSFRRASGRFRRGGRFKTGGYKGRAVGFTSETSTAPYVGYKARRLSGAQWRRALWRDTQAKSHYKSNGASTALQATPGVATLQISRAQNAFSLDGGRFWSVTGGTVQLDQGTVVPTFEGDITLRGGKVGMSIYNASTVTPAKVKLYLIRDSSRATLVNLPATPAVGFDLREMAEFRDDVGKIIYQRDLVIKPLGVGTVEYRLRPEKIDQLNWLAPTGSQYTWITLSTDYDDTLTNNIRYTSYHNVSFSADVSNPGV